MKLLRNQKKRRDQRSKLEDSHALLMDCTDHTYTSNVYKQSYMIDSRMKSIMSQTQSRSVDSGLKSVESLNQHYKVLSTDVIELKVETSKNVSVVYTRRSRRNSVATHITEGKDIVNHAEEHAMDACSKDLTARSKEVFPEMQNDKENTVARKRTTRRKRDRPVSTKDSEVFEIEVSTEFKHPMASSLSMQNEDGNTAASKPLRQRVRRVSVRESEIIEAEVAKDVKEQQVTTLVNIEPWTMLVHKKLQPEWTAYNPLSMRPRFLCDSSIKLLSWNVNGLRALLKRKGEVCESPILDLAQKEDFDVLCLQETKIQCKDVSVIKDSILPGYDNSYWNCSNAKLGYAGTAVLSRIKPLSVHYGLGVSDHDNEGRLITLEFESFYIVAGYIPNSGRKLERLMYRTQEWDPSLSKFLKRLEKTKPVILTGDLNCAHQEMDIYNPDGNRRSAGFTDEERSSFEANFLNQGLVDTFRKQHPHALAYTYWGYRTAARPKNQGWRLDYFLASEAIMGRVQDSYTLPYVGGSDHCPVGLILQV